MPHRNKTTFHQSKAAQLLAIALGVMPIYLLAFFGGLEVLSSGEFSIPGVKASLDSVVLETLLFGGLMLGLLIFLCKDSLASLQPKPGNLGTDSSTGIVLGLTLLGAMILLGMGLNLVDFHQTPTAIISLAKELADNPLLLAVYLGPVILIKAAFLEEFTRVFLLTRMWKIWDRPEDKEPSVVLAAMLFGLGHIYQGVIGVVGTALIGYILGKAYLKGGRFLPLVIGHALYDITMVLILVSLVKTGTLDAAL